MNNLEDLALKFPDKLLFLNMQTDAIMNIVRRSKYADTLLKR